MVYVPLFLGCKLSLISWWKGNEVGRMEVYMSCLQFLMFVLNLLGAIFLPIKKKILTFYEDLKRKVENLQKYFSLVQVMAHLVGLRNPVSCSIINWWNCNDTPCTKTMNYFKALNYNNRVLEIRAVGWENGILLNYKKINLAILTT